MALQMPKEALFGISIQGTGVPSDTGFGTAETTGFSYYPVVNMGLGSVKPQDVLPQEIGGRAMPGGAFATGAWAQGPVSMIPRLNNRFGWLLLAAMGEVSTVSDTKVSSYVAGTSGSDAGINTHIFTFHADDQHFIPYFTVRKLNPHTTSANELGETYQDCRITGMTIAAAGASPVRMDMAMQGRLEQSGSDQQFDFDPGWGTPTYDNYEDFPVTNCSGSFKIEGTEFDVTAATITLANQTLPPQQAMRIGSIHPLDNPVLQRIVTVTATILIDDYNLYVSTFSGATNAGTDDDASCIVYKADADIELTSQTYISGTDPYIIRFRSDSSQDNVAWQATPINYTPGRPVVIQLTGTFLSTESGDPIELLLQNSQANYTVT